VGVRMGKELGGWGGFRWVGAGGFTLIF